MAAFNSRFSIGDTVKLQVFEDPPTASAGGAFSF